MASVFKRKRKVKLANGKNIIKQSQKYYTRLTDADGIKRTIPLFRDRTASQQRAAQLQKEIELARAGVIDRYKEHRRKPLSEHLKDFRQSLLDKGNTENHVELTHNRVKIVLKGCKFVFIADISASKVQRYLADLRNNGEGISAQTFNFYLQTMKQFCKWMVQDQRASESPLEHLKGLNVHTDRRHDRRTLEPDEVRRLLEATVAAMVRFGMTGYERYLLYRFATETGLRANEIRNLTVGSFDFKKLHVTVNAGYSKRRREDVQYLKPDTALLLQEFFKDKMPNVKAFGGNYKQLTKRTSDMIRADLAETEKRDSEEKVIKEAIPYIDDSGRYADFHSLRHTTGSLLATSGVHPKVAQSIMRHSDINLTMSRYTHILTGQESEAVSKLPDFSLPSSQKQIATGTDNEPIITDRNDSEKLTPQLTPTTYSGYDRPTAIDTENKNSLDMVDNQNSLSKSDLGIEGHSLSPDDTQNGEGGIRTRGTGLYPYDGLANRCLQPLGHLSKLRVSSNLQFTS